MLLQEKLFLRNVRAREHATNLDFATRDEVGQKLSAKKATSVPVKQLATFRDPPTLKEVVTARNVVMSAVLNIRSCASTMACNIESAIALLAIQLWPVGCLTAVLAAFVDFSSGF